MAKHQSYYMVIPAEVWDAQLANLRAKLLTIPTKAAPRAAILDDEKMMVKYLLGSA